MTWFNSKSPSPRKQAKQNRSVRLAVESLERRDTPTTLPTGFTENIVATGLVSPTAMEIAPDGRIFITEQGGNLRVVQNGQLQAAPFVSLTVDSSGERGLLGVTFDPNFATNHYVFVYYTTTAGGTAHNRISRFTANGNVAVAGSEFVLADLDALSSATNHNGGAIHVGLDNKLYVGVGENGNGANAQSLSNRLGKLLRYNLDGTIPSDNPTSFPGIAGTTSGANKAIWAVGLRNPFSFTVQPTSGRIFINDVGQNTYEEINDAIKGANYGWSIAEGPSSNPNFMNPLFFYGHGAGNTLGFAITGGAFYVSNTPQFPSDYNGDYFFADFVNNWIRRYDPTTGTVTLFASGITSLPVDLKVDSLGNLLYLTRGNGGNLTAVHFTTPQDQAFVGALYQTFLGRTAASSEIDYWAFRVGSAGKDAVANAIERSPESLGRMVDGVYTQLLGRPSDPNGRTNWTNALINGATMEQVISGFTVSGEFAARATALEQTGDANADYVRALYRLLLQRTNASAADVNGWVQRMTVAGRGGIAQGFTRSIEFRSNSVSSFYGPATPLPFLRNILGRTSTATAPEINGWVNSGLDVLVLERLFASSNEYYVNS